MAWKVEMEMMRISYRGNNSAYSLIDSAIALFILSITLLAMLVLVKSTVNYSDKQNKQIREVVNIQNELAEKIISKSY